MAKKHQPGCPCCPEPCACGGDEDYEFEAVVAGLTNGSCSNCSVLNDTYIIPFTECQLYTPGGSPAERARYQLAAQGQCSSDNFEISLFDDTSSLPAFNLKANLTFLGLIWTTAGSGISDDLEDFCTADGLVLYPSSSGTFCNASGATITITRQLA